MKNKVLILTISLILIIMMIIGATYAYFTANISGEESSETLTVTGGSLSIAVDGGNSINIQNIIPGPEAKLSKIITLTGTNTTELSMPYTMSLVVESNTFRDNAISYTLESENPSDNGIIVTSITENQGITTGSSTIELGTGRYNKGNTLVHEYTLKIYFKETDTDQNEEQGKEINGYVKLESKEAFVPAPEGWFTSQNGTLLKAIKDNNLLKEPLTTPGRELSLSSFEDITAFSLSVNEVFQARYWTYGTGYEKQADGKYNLTGVATLLYSSNYADLVGKYLVSTSASGNSNSTDTEKPTTNLEYIVKVETATDSSLTYKPNYSPADASEAVFAATEDDYGTSYYYRGAVENNYVVFANMCWRIVRVVGDGSIKLVLYNYSSASCETTGTSDAFARYSGETYKTAFNTDNGPNAYIGFMYGDPDSDDYTAEHTNTTNSTILNNLETWYNRDDQFDLYEHNLADTIWCNDKSIDTVYPFGTVLGYGTHQTGYSARGRLYADAKYATEAAPSLICPKAGADGKLSKFTDDDMENGNGTLKEKIGLLTADEVAFAGSRHTGTNVTYYLNKNAGSDWWWTMSPGHSLSASAYVLGAYFAGIMVYGYVNDSGALRPAVSLLSTTTITSGNGSLSNPYVVS